MQRMVGAHLLGMNNRKVKFKYKGMKLLELQITQTRHPYAFWMRKMS